MEKLGYLAHNVEKPVREVREKREGRREEDDGEATRKGGRASWGSTCYVLDLLSHNLTVDAGGIILILRGQT